MANTRVEAYGHDKNRTKETSMLGSEGVTANVHTWSTFIRSSINRDGTGYVTIERDGVTIHTFSITEPEGR